MDGDSKVCMQLHAKQMKKNVRANNNLIAGSVWLAENILVVNFNFVPLIYELWSAFVELLVLLIEN